MLLTLMMLPTKGQKCRMVAEITHTLYLLVRIAIHRAVHTGQLQRNHLNCWKAAILKVITNFFDVFKEL